MHHDLAHDIGLAQTARPKDGRTAGWAGHGLGGRHGIATLQNTMIASDAS
jgi:hypothetical protein